MAPIGGMTETTNATGMMLSIMPKMVRLVIIPTRPGRPPPTAPAPDPASATTADAFRAKSESASVPAESETSPPLRSQGEDLDPAPPLRAYIESRYSPEDAKRAEQDLETLTLLRSETMATGQTPEQKRETLLSYYRALRVVESRFPISKQAGHVNLPFTWTDAFDTKRKATVSDAKFERCATLFNLACSWTTEACDADRDDAEGAKVAARAFQRAAGAFAALEKIGEKAVPGARRGDADTPTMDVSKECAAAMGSLCLAQAQKCVFDKAARDGKSHGALAKLAKQAHLFYAEAEAALAASPLSEHIDASWRVHVGAMAALHLAEAEAAAAAALADDEDGVGPKIARLTRASRELAAGARAVRSANGVSVGLITALMSLKDTIDRDLQKHSRENEVVYMVRVPAYEDLPELGAAAMVKPAPPAPESLDAAGETLFSNIVPESGFTALSKYTELVDATIREETDVLALASDEARAALAEMELPELLIAAEAGAASAVPGGAGDAAAAAGAGLPAPLAEEVAAAQRAGVSAGFRGDVARLREAHDACAHRVDATERALDAEATEDEACRGAYGGDKWTRPPSAALSRNLREKVAAYRQNLAQAFRSDESLRARVADASEGVLRLLEPESMAAATPALRAPMVSTSDGDVLAELRAATSDLEAIGAERAGIEATAKAIKERDNIMAKVMAAENPGAHEALFERELEKYDEVKAAVASNVSSQADVLGRLRREREAFARAYDVDGWRAASAIHAEATRDALAHYRELASGIERGTTFYAGFAAATTQLLEEAEAWVESRRREKAQLEAAVAQRAQAAAEVAQNHAAAAAAAHRAAADQAAAGRAMAEAHARQATAATHALYDPYAPPTHAPAPPPGVGGAHGYPPAPTSPPAPTRVEYPPQPQQAFAPFAPPPPPGSHLYPPNPYGQQPPPPPHGYR